MGDMARPLARDRAHRVRQQFQRTVLAVLPKPAALDLEPRIRWKLRRWELPGFPRTRVRQAISFLQHLRGRVPPRVWAASMRALWNAWPTRRRLQGRGGLPGCVFDCIPGAQDSIEHYSTCRVLSALATQELGLVRPATLPRRLADFLGLVDVPAGEDGATRRAIRIAATYRIHCLACNGRLAMGRPAREAFRQACREVVRGSSYGERVYDAAAGGWA